MSNPNPTPTQRLESLLSRNEKYAETYPTPPHLRDGIEKRKKSGAKSMVIISCADPRIHPEKYLGLQFGEAAILRNSGGRTHGEIRSLLVLDALGDVGTVVVIHHTDCGTSQFGENGEEEFQRRIERRHPGIAKEFEGVVWGAIGDPYKTVVEDVAFLKSHETIRENMEVFGLVLDTFSGVLERVI